jgi:hypothetical protein
MEFNISEIINKNLGGLLNEGRLEDVKAKYPNNSANYVSALSERDPSGNNKYLAWLAKVALWSTKEIRELSGGEDNDWHIRRYGGRWKVDIDTLISNLEHFHNNPQKYEKKDINQYKTDKELDDATEIAKTKLSRKELKDQGGEKVYEDDNFILIHPKTHEASCKYGSRTRWCVTMRGYTGYFERYSTNGPLFFLIDKRRLEATRSMRTPDYYKIALHYQPRFPRYGVMGDKGHFAASAKQLTKDEFINSASQNQVMLDYWNVQDKNVAESTVLKYLGGPGRGQKQRGTEALTNLKGAMESYTKKTLGDFWDKVHSEGEDTTQQRINEIDGLLNKIESKRDYYFDVLERLENMLYYLRQHRENDDLKRAYNISDDDDVIPNIDLDLTDEKMAEIVKREEEIRDGANQLDTRVQELRTERSNLRNSKKNEFAFYDLIKNVPQN